MSKEERKKDLLVTAKAEYLVDCIPGLIETYALLAPLWTYLILSFLVFLAGPAIYKDAPDINRSITHFSLWTSILIPIGVFLSVRQVRFARSRYASNRILIESRLTEL